MIKNSKIYTGKVIHRRFKPKEHYFKYSVFSLLIDLDELEDIQKEISIFSYNKFNIISFFDKDHGERDSSSLKNWVYSNLKTLGIEEEVKIKLLCYPRIFGYVFNPLSIFLYTIKIQNLLLFYMKLKIHLVNNIPMFLKQMMKKLFKIVVKNNFMYLHLLK